MLKLARVSLASAFVAAGASLSGPARPQEVAEMAPFREAFPVKQEVCFVRNYDAGHLKAYPEQGVATIRLSRLTTERRREDVEGPEAPSFALKLGVRMRDGTSGSEGLDCEAVYVDLDKRTPSSPPGYLVCGSICGRGSLDVTPMGSGKIKISIGGEAGGRFVADAVGVGRSCANDAGVTWLGDRAAERVFLLDRAKLKACR